MEIKTLAAAAVSAMAFGGGELRAIGVGRVVERGIPPALTAAPVAWGPMT